MRIRDERRDDREAISELVTAAFVSAPHSSGNEAAIVEALRAAGALTVSLVAEEDGRIVGHAAVSPVAIAGEAGWYGLGPVAVLPARQRRGIGCALIRHATDRLREGGERGCVLVGEPVYYGRFGFVHDARLAWRDLPPPFLQILAFGPPPKPGEVAFHPAFDTGAV